MLLKRFEKEKYPFYLGLIGSKNKAKEFKEKLKSEGFLDEKLKNSFTNRNRYKCNHSR